MMKRLIKRINNKSATIGIIGLGYVGLPLVIRFVEENFAVIGFDIDRSIIKLNYNPKIDIESGIPLFIDWYNRYTSK